MSIENYHLRFNSFGVNTQNTWKQLQGDNKFCDVTLACDNQQIRAHKIVLSSSSPVLQSILIANENLHPVIYLRGVKYRDMVCLVSFMYQGEVTVAKQDLQSFLSTAEDLQVNGLPEQRQESITSQLPETDQDKPAKCKKIKKLKIKALSLPEEENVFKEDFYGHDIQIDNDLSETKFIDTQVERQEIEESNPCEIRTDTLAKRNKLKSKVNETDNSSNVNSTLSCEQCEKLFQSKCSLLKHVKSRHDGVRYPCTHCDYKATQNWSLQNHVKSVHEGLRYTCSQCEFTATFKSGIMTHVKKSH